MKAFLPVLLLGLLAPLGVQAAAIKGATFGCKTEADASKALGLQIKKDPGLKAFTDPKVASGACVAFGRGVAVTPDVKKPPLDCVRLAGGLDCYWVSDSVVDLNPPEAQSDRPSRGGGRRRQ